jgi:hypothetical protein
MNELAITTGLALLLSPGYAFAEPMTSGRPSAAIFSFSDQYDEGTCYAHGATHFFDWPNRAAA